jgi:hypothetical protein
VNRKQDNLARSQATASWFGISQQALSEIEETVHEHLRERALRLSMERPWESLANQLFHERGGGDRVAKALSAEDFVREFGLSLHSSLARSGEEYVEMLTRAIVEHDERQRKPIRWESIAEQAIRFCSREAAWENSAEWLVRGFKMAGLETSLFTVRTKVVFETSLFGWLLIFRTWDDKDPVTNFFEVAARKIRHIARLAPQNSIQAPTNEQEIESRVPTVAELKNKGAISQKHAAEHLRCDPRTIRNYIQRGKLTRTSRGLVVCDDKLTQRLREKFGPALRIKSQ